MGTSARIGSRRRRPPGGVRVLDTRRIGSSVRERPDTRVRLRRAGRDCGRRRMPVRRWRTRGHRGRRRAVVGPRWTVIVAVRAARRRAGAGPGAVRRPHGRLRGRRPGARAGIASMPVAGRRALFVRIRATRAKMGSRWRRPVSGTSRMRGLTIIAPPRRAMIAIASPEMIRSTTEGVIQKREERHEAHKGKIRLVGVAEIGVVEVVVVPRIVGNSRILRRLRGGAGHPAAAICRRDVDDRAAVAGALPRDGDPKHDVGPAEVGDERLIATDVALADQILDDADLDPVKFGRRQGSTVINGDDPVGAEIHHLRRTGRCRNATRGQERESTGKKYSDNRQSGLHGDWVGSGGSG